MKTPIAIISGATSGLGTAFANHLAANGWNLFLTGRRQQRLQSLQEQLESRYHIKVKTCKADLLDTDQLNKLLGSISHLSSIDMLINNAGFGCRDDFYEVEYSTQQQMLQVHITAASKLIQKVVPLMKEQGCGTIINVASLGAFLPAPLSYFYCSSKAFLVSLSECMHIDLKRYNIKIQALCPGFIHTEFHSRMGIQSHESWLENKLLWMSEKKVVDICFRKLSNHKVICIPGLVNQLIYQIARWLPKVLYYQITELHTNKVKNLALTT